MTEKLLADIIQLANLAGEAIISLYSNTSIDVKFKEDSSPVTKADMLSNKLIRDGLLQIDNQALIISEEIDAANFTVRQHWQRYWLIDPLDGTKEFIDKTDEFTVNIALIENNKPILGVVHAPVLNKTYYALKGEPAYVIANGVTKKITTAKDTVYPPRITVSRRHGEGAKLSAFLAELGEHEIIVCGSTIKICLVAEGLAELYPRFGLTNEWDTAAGQCILEAAGGSVIDQNGSPLVYNKPSLINPEFFALSKNAWQDNAFCLPVACG